MKRKLTVKALILPLLIAFLVLLPLIGAAAIGEHRYEVRHPAYMHHFWLRLIGEEDAEGNPIGPADDLPAALAEDGCVRILVLGKDRAAGLTDVMLLATLDGETGQLDLLQLPRDTYAAYTDASYKKLNGAYAKLGGEGLTAFLREHLGVPIDHYVCIDLEVLGELVDLMGGVRLTVPDAMDYDDPEQDLHIHLSAGEQTLDGTMAQMFVRFRSGYALADMGRMDAQKLFLAALARDAKQRLTVGQTLSLVMRCFGKIKTDMSLGQSLSIAKALRQVPLEGMCMATMPGAAARTGGDRGAWYYVLNRAATEDLLCRRAGGTEGDFDPAGIFNDPSKESFAAVYHGEAENYPVRVYSAEALLEGGLDIRRLS